MLQTVFMVLHLLVAAGLIASVLLQSGKSAGLSGAIAGAGETFFGRRKGMDEFLGRLTTYLAVTFMALSIVIIVLL